MKQMKKERTDSRGFTIVELLTVMSIIILLMGLFIPAMTSVRRYARRVAQHNQFHAIEVGLAIFDAEWKEVPDITSSDVGAIVLAESMVGKDQLGYDPDGRYNQKDLSNRRAYLAAGNANANSVILYPEMADTGVDPNIFILSDIYPHISHPKTGRLLGMPVLYYKAKLFNRYHGQIQAETGDSIYDYKDNHSFIQALSIPGDNTGKEHAMVADPETTFYEGTRNYHTIITLAGEEIVMPYRPTSYILISAGADGEYGTEDDVYNFGI